MAEKNAMEVMNELQVIFRDVFDDDNLVLTPETNAENIEDWDSLSHIRLIVATEKKFGIKFSYDELQSMKNVGEMSVVISRKLSEKNEQ